MKLNFINMNPKKPINLTKRFLKTLPEERRNLIATMMWTGIIPDLKEMQKIMGIGLYSKLVGRDEKKFKEALAIAPGKAWKLLEEKTQAYLDDKLDQVEKEKYKKQLFEETYKNEPVKLQFLKDYFSSGEINKAGFKLIIQNDIQESHTKAYKEHLDFWVQ